jgi:hypothetical protein
MSVSIGVSIVVGGDHRSASATSRFPVFASRRSPAGTSE